MSGRVLQLLTKRYKTHIPALLRARTLPATDSEKFKILSELDAVLRDEYDNSTFKQLEVHHFQTIDRGLNKLLDSKPVSIKQFTAPDSVVELAQGTQKSLQQRCQSVRQLSEEQVQQFVKLWLRKPGRKDKRLAFAAVFNKNLRNSSAIEALISHIAQAQRECNIWRGQDYNDVEVSMSIRLYKCRRQLNNGTKAELADIELARIFETRWLPYMEQGTLSEYSKRTAMRTYFALDKTNQNRRKERLSRVVDRLTEHNRFDDIFALWQVVPLDLVPELVTLLAGVHQHKNCYSPWQVAILDAITRRSNDERALNSLRRRTADLTHQMHNLQPI
ncbi:Hypothetical protein PP7435_CHR3-0208 [Komagataella phaffii CBS 7435]|uniref:Uncharacterized protein n=2 Tax=Komagataella phaffii TaxID=460519 RepID=C4R638_KOMPG|nr:Hypothetical protein PAS_chr3_0963 [Komagataella phaffii GS115]AOA63687.1 GQ67_04091T0 [Komagataella phaffii]CAH2449154.1 Hypothetical protein BQ9382_C3-1165 [Komagataella phaffii CBS 7435]AOA68431.1 GQ68_04064T0 [Komagataella phaffii GS115]CAY71024.1 Hypothetical protein PAS_chr3_0963 [Komagataella phaffii GS115]CCA39180.1 Hypothetical protein PP7435_CHR3-0208 [Komagataella phaffii CBS 7435]